MIAITPDRREADELAAAFSKALARDVRPSRIRYDGAQPDEWQLFIGGLHNFGFELDAVRRFVDTARAMALGGRRVQLVVLCDGEIFAVSTRGVHKLDYETGEPTLADAEIASIVIEKLPN